jgi:hypothetical protein
MVRRIFDLAVEHGNRVDNPARFVDRRRGETEGIAFAVTGAILGNGEAR